MALLLSCLLGAGCAADAPDDSRNVVLIVVDTLRADNLTHYGYSRATSSGLADFAAHSTLFSQAYATSSWTQPSVASLFTGILPSSHRVLIQGRVLSPDFETLAERLSRAGWSSSAFSGNLFIGSRTGSDQGFENFVGHDGDVLAYPDVADMLDSVDSWLVHPERAMPPLFLYFQPMNSHGPYTVPEERRDDLLGYEPDTNFRYRGEIMQSIVRDGNLEARARVTPEILQSLTDQYDTAVRYSLDSVGELLNLLKARNLYDDSLIIVTSDHGEELFDHGGFSHAYSLYEEVVRVPLWIKLPGQTRASQIDHPVSLLDIYPTVLDLFDLEASQDLHGTSLLPLLGKDTSSAPGSSRPILFETRWQNRAVAAGIRLGPYKLIDIRTDYEGRQDTQLLFNLENDPEELENLAAHQPEILESMVLELIRRIRPQASSEVPARVEFDPQALEALGYLD